MRAVIGTILALVSVGCLALGRREALYDPDVLFILEASQYLNTAVTLSEEAAERSVNQQVQHFAAEVAHTHGAARDELSAIGREQALSIPKKMEPLSRLTARGIENLPIDYFDREYLLRLLADSTRMTVLLSKRNSYARNRRLLAWERAQLPVFRECSSSAAALLGQVDAGGGFIQKDPACLHEPYEKNHELCISGPR